MSKPASRKRFEPGGSNSATPLRRCVAGRCSEQFRACGTSLTGWEAQQPRLFTRAHSLLAFKRSSKNGQRGERRVGTRIGTWSRLVLGSQSRKVEDLNLPTRDADNALGFKAIELARYRLAVRSDTGSELVMCRGRADENRLTGSQSLVGQPQQFAPNPLPGRQSADLEDAFRHQPDLGDQKANQLTGNDAVLLHHGIEPIRRHAGDEAIGGRDDGGTARQPVDRGKLAKDVTFAELAIDKLAAFGGRAAYPHRPIKNEEHVTAGILLTGNLDLAQIASRQAVERNPREVRLGELLEERNDPEVLGIPIIHRFKGPGAMRKKRPQECG